MNAEDRAQKEEADEWERRNMNKAEVKHFEPGEQGYGPELCQNEDCGEEMLAPRRAWGFTHCTDCQGIIERRAKRGY